MSNKILKLAALILLLATPLFGAHIVFDSFHRADADTLGTAETGQVWSAPAFTSTFGTRSGTATWLIAGTMVNEDSVTVDSGVTDCEVYATFVTNVANMRIVGRSDGTGSNLWITQHDQNANGLGTYQLVNDGYTEIAFSNDGNGVNPNDVVSMIMTNGTFVIKANGVTEYQFFDYFNMGQTNHGIGFFFSSFGTPGWKDFAIDTTAAIPTPTPMSSRIWLEQSAWLEQANPNTSHKGDANTLVSGTSAANDNAIFRYYQSFPGCIIYSPAVAISASLTLNVVGTTGTMTSVEVHRILPVSINFLSCAPSWNHPRRQGASCNNTFWNGGNDGCGLPDVDYDSVVAGTLTSFTPGLHTITIDRDQATQMMADTGFYGWLLIDTTGAGSHSVTIDGTLGTPGAGCQEQGSATSHYDVTYFLMTPTPLPVPPTSTPTATPTVGPTIVATVRSASVIVNGLIWDEQGGGHTPTKLSQAQQFFDRTTLIAGTTDKKTRVCWLVISALHDTNRVWLESTSGTRLTGDFPLKQKSHFPMFPREPYILFDTAFGEGVVLRVLNGTARMGIDIGYYTH